MSVHIRIVFVGYIVNGLLAALVAISRRGVLELLDEVVIAVATAALAGLPVGSGIVGVHLLVRNRGDVIVVRHGTIVNVAARVQSRAGVRRARRKALAREQQRQQQRWTTQTLPSDSGAVLCRVSKR